MNNSTVFSTADSRRPSRPALWVAILGVLFVGLNLRPAITSVAFVLPQIRNDYALGATAAGLLTTVPLLAFVLFSLQVPRWGRKSGIARLILVALVLLAVGFAIRMVPSATALFIGMAVCGAAITVGNVLLPAFIKSRYPDHGGILTGVYTVSLYAGPALASALTVPMYQATGSWRVALLGWGILIVIAIPLWLSQIGRARITGGVPAGQRVGGTVKLRRIFTRPLAWSVTVYFAVLSVLFFTVSAWLPTMFVARGFGEAAGGTALTTVNLVAIPCALVVSILVHRSTNQVWATTIGSIGLAVGIAGLYFGSQSSMLLWATVFGIGHGTATGIAFSLAMLRTRTADGTAALGAMSQTAGYTLSAIGPVGAGLLHDLTGTWSSLVILLVLITTVQCIAGFMAGRPVKLEDQL